MYDPLLLNRIRDSRITGIPAVYDAYMVEPPETEANPWENTAERSLSVTIAKTGAEALNDQPISNSVWPENPYLLDESVECLGAKYY